MRISRRTFLEGSVAFLAAGCVGPQVLPPRRIAPGSLVNVALIGCGTQGKSNLDMLLVDNRLKVTVVCDPVLEAPGYSYKAQMVGGMKPFKARIDAAYKDNSCRMVADWRAVVADPTIDAVFVCTPDHWHAIISIAAMKAGKHVYCQKPMALSIEEGIVMTRVAKETGVTFQVGNQGRSNPVRRTASELIRNNILGKTTSCMVCLPEGSGGKWGHDINPHPAPRPAYFSEEMWNLWQGPAEHWENNAFIPGIHEPMCWRWNRRYGNGMIADFTPHEVDIVHWAMDFERTGPVAIENVVAGGFQENRAVYSWAGTFSYDLKYATGFTMRVRNVEPNLPRGILYSCEEGAINLYGQKLEIKDRNGKDIAKQVLRDWKHETRNANSKLTRLYAPKDGHSHESDFIDGILEGRQVCSECEFGHRTTTTSHLANICIDLGLTKAAWDPVAERFVGKESEAANRRLAVPYANGWKLI